VVTTAERQYGHTELALLFPEPVTNARSGKTFSHIRFCRPNARWLTLLDDFVTTNFGTRAPHALAPPPEQNSGDDTAGKDGLMHKEVKLVHEVKMKVYSIDEATGASHTEKSELFCDIRGVSCNVID